MPKPPHVHGAPDAEHLRSPAASRIAELASRSQLFFAHYEQRVMLPLPASWRPAHTDPEGPPQFEAGVLAEPKYGAFRHDLMVASFHPLHRAQWTAHELCHVLVGFAFRPSAPLLFHALAAWLAELLPVSLWYFFDEAHLRRCPRHAGQGPLFQAHCDDCEAEALAGPRSDDAESRRRIREGRAFMDRELRALARSKRLGRCEGSRYATIDLASDALAYARAHGPRLGAPETARWAELFFAPHQGLHAELDALEERVLAVRDALLGEGRVSPHRASRWDYAAQDVGYRLFTVAAGLSDARRAELVAMAERLAAARSPAGLRRAIADYTALGAEKRPRRAPALPSPEAMFAVGYPLVDGVGRSRTQIAEGVQSACPSSCAALGRKLPEVIAAFEADDAPARVAIGRRFAAHLARARPGPIAELAALEAAVCHARPPSAELATLPASEAAGEHVTLAEHAELVRAEHAVASVEPKAVARLAKGAAHYLGVARGADGAIDVIALPEAAGRALLLSRGRPCARTELGLGDDDVQALLDAGLLAPAAYRWETLGPRSLRTEARWGASTRRRSAQ
jgi:hypothetical protein